MNSSTWGIKRSETPNFDPDINRGMLALVRNETEEDELAEELRQLVLAQQDPRHFKYFYDKYYKRIFLFIFRRTEEENTTADICSQVFLKALQKLKDFKHQGVPFSAWLFRIASNEVTQHFRDNSKVRTISLDVEDIESLKGDGEGEGIKTASALNIIDKTGEEASISDEELFSAMKTLKADDLEFIEMRFFEKMSFREIGNIKEITENNAKVKVYRIVDKLREKLNTLNKERK